MPYLHLQPKPAHGHFGCCSDCHCTRTRPSVHSSFGESTFTSQFSESERDTVASEIIKIANKPGIRHVNQLSDQIFFARHPNRNKRLIDPKTEPNLAEEWKNIKGRLVLPILEAIDSNEKGKEAMYASKYVRAIGFFDRARRISIAPTLNRARATFNLGTANFQLKRFAAAMGYMEIVRNWEGSSKELDDLRAKAGRFFMQAKEEYRKAVPTT